MYTVKTRTEKRTREVRGASISSYVTEEYTVYIAELFAGDVVTDCGEGATDSDAFEALDRKLFRTWQSLVDVHRERLQALHAARYGEVPFG